VKLVIGDASIYSESIARETLGLWLGISAFDFAQARLSRLQLSRFVGSLVLTLP